MIEKNAQNIQKYKNKIVFAPNGFGKTQFANYLLGELEKERKNVAFFSTKKITQLVKTNENTIYYGEAAEYNNQKATLKSEIESSEILENFYKRNYKNFTSFKGCFFGKINSKHLKRNDADAWILLIASNKNYLNNDFEILDKYLEFDKSIDIKIYEDCQLVIKSIGEYADDCLKNDVIDDETAIVLQKIKAYAEGKGEKSCPLCGHVFDSFQTLIESIKNKVSSYTTESVHKISTKIDAIAVDIRKQIHNSSFLENEFINIDKNNELVSHYYDLCIETITSIYNQIANIQISDCSLYEICEKMAKCNNKITTVVNNYKTKPELLSYIEESIRNLIVFRSNVRLEFNNDNLSFKLVSNDSELSVEENLSESELKRLSLIILKALIKFFNYDTIVLDDPIDSYDDYYLSIACSFISGIITEDCANKDWYIFTNNINCLSSISLKTNSQGILATDNPNIIFNNDSDDSIEITVNPEEFEVLNSNELCLLAKYLNPSLKILGLDTSYFSSSSLPFIAFIVTARNFNDVVNRNFDKVTFDPSFKNNKRNLIEHCFMHYDHIGVIDTRGCTCRASSSFLLSEMYQIYDKIITICNPNVTTLSSTTLSCVDERTNLLSTNYSTFDGSKFLNYIFYKILAMSEIRFKIEKKIVDILSGLPYISASDVTGFINKDCLGNKIDYLGTLAHTGTDVSDLYDKVNKIYLKHSTIINEFDHALNQMFPPYIATSSIDIKDLNDMVDSL